MCRPSARRQRWLVPREAPLARAPASIVVAAVAPSAHREGRRRVRRAREGPVCGDSGNQSGRSSLPPPWSPPGQWRPCHTPWALGLRPDLRARARVDQALA